MVQKKGNIGIVGGMGPMAGIDLSRRVIENTLATHDQEHIPQVLFSLPGKIPDRSDYLQGIVNTNPGYQIAGIITQLESAGCFVAGIACNTAHAEKIFKIVRSEIKTRELNIKLLHMIEETGKFISEYYPGAKSIGVLGTNGTAHFRVYDILTKHDLQVLYPDKELQKKVHDAVYHPDYGIKSTPNGESQRAEEILTEAFEKLHKMKAECILLACTELPMVFNKPDYNGIPLVNPTEILARALIREHSPRKLKPLSWFR